MLRRTMVVLALGTFGCADKMKVPSDPGLYSTQANGDERSGAPLDMSAGTGRPEPPPLETGEASWYGKALAGRKTASGERFDPRAYTAAHRTLKIGTWVEVRRLDTRSSVRVRINDRGPHVAGRIIDLSQKAAEDIDIVRAGTARVELRVVSGP